ncbi:hypothetical protein TrVE_jg3303 [Triparma verrucosa]|uniref:Phytanoyl-CoA dioxygenase n=1 Tax=Triparma verrucosa TaxID=1606542 RepID=A0A9W7FF31_9STRA|nr:hypothetical protein TrVE_jg3303 [Triparma verrucosa]
MADDERDLLEQNTYPMLEPVPGKKKSKARSAGGGGGFGVGAKIAPGPVVSTATKLRLETLQSEGVCYVPGVLGKDTAADMIETVQGELSRAMKAIKEDPAGSVARFNVPADVIDPLRGYLLLPLRDEGSVEAGDPNGATVRALRECLSTGTVLGDLFGSDLCGGGDAEWYDLTALRTEAGATRQPIHYDTPYQKVPGLFCAFIAMSDVEYSKGATVFLPGTHKNTAERRAFEEGGEAKDVMLSKKRSAHTVLKAGDAVVFDMRTLHAGTANLALSEGGGQRLLFILTFRNRKATGTLGHAPNLRPSYRHRGITLGEMREELDSPEPFAGDASDGVPFGDGLQQ